MVDLIINDKHLNNVGLVIFDRDGTLIDLYHYWAQMIEKRAHLICQRYNLEKSHHDNIMFAMGVDTANKRLRPEGPVGIKKREIVMQAAVDYLSGLELNNTKPICAEMFEQVDRQTEKKNG